MSKENTRYLLCELDDENYTEPRFAVFESKKLAINKAIEICLEAASDNDLTLEIKDNQERISVNFGDCFYITQINKFDSNDGGYILVWHHAYNGVGFDIECVGSYEECKLEMDKCIRERQEQIECDLEWENDFQACVDTGEEWEIWSIIKIEDGGGIIMEMNYEHTPREMAEKLMEFNRDFSDSEADISEETTYLEEIFEKLQKSDEFEILAHHLDEMFADPVFEEGRKYLDIYREDYAPGQFREILRTLDVSDSQAGDGFMLACNVVRSTLTKAEYKVKIKASEEYTIEAGDRYEAEEIARERFGNNYLIDDIEITENEE